MTIDFNNEDLAGYYKKYQYKYKQPNPLISFIGYYLGGFISMGFFIYIPVGVVFWFLGLSPKDVVIAVAIIWFVILLKWRLCKHGSFFDCDDCTIEGVKTDFENEKRLKEEADLLRKEREKEEKRLKIEREEAERLEQIKLKSRDYLLSISPEEFENAVAKLFNNLGYSVKQTPFTGDGGLDAVATKDGIKFLIECKRYALDNLVGRPELQKFFAAIVQENAKGGFFVTTSNFSDNAKEFIQNEHIKQRRIELIDGDKLIRMIQKAYPEENNIGGKLKNDINPNQLKMSLL